MNTYLFKTVIFLFSINTLFAQLKINWSNNEYLFYNTKNLKELPFTLENADEVLVLKMKNIQNHGPLKKNKIL